MYDSDLAMKNKRILWSSLSYVLKIFELYVILRVFYSCNMGTNDLRPRTEGIHFRQITSAHVTTTVGPRLSESRLSEPLIIRTVVETILIEYFVNRCMFY